MMVERLREMVKEFDDFEDGLDDFNSMELGPSKSVKWRTSKLAGTSITYYEARQAIGFLLQKIDKEKESENAK